MTTTGPRPGAAALAPRPGDAAGTVPSPSGGPSTSSAGTGVAAAAAVVGLLALLVLAITVGGGVPDGAAGLDRNGPLVHWGVPVARLAARVAALGTVGALSFAAVLRPSGRTLPAACRRAARAAAWWALAWAGTTALHAVLTLSELVGVPPASLAASSVWTFATGTAPGRAALSATAGAFLVALLARRCRSTAAAALLLAVALSGLVLPAVLTGHSATAESHLLAVTTLAVHVVGAALWTGSLLALLLNGRDPAELARTATRFSVVALVCFLATGASGLLAAWLVLGGDAAAPAAVAGTGYGWLLAGKAAGLVALGGLGWYHRRRTLPALRAGRAGSFRRFAAVEAGVMLATITLAVALSGSPPPVAGGQPVGPRGAPPVPPATAAAGPGLEDMAGHDHGELSVTVLVDDDRFHVSAAVPVGARVTVHNGTTTEVSLTADDGSFDVTVPGRTLTTFRAPDEPGSYAFSSRHSAALTGVLVVES